MFNFGIKYIFRNWFTKHQEWVVCFDRGPLRVYCPICGPLNQPSIR